MLSRRGSKRQLIPIRSCYPFCRSIATCCCFLHHVIRRRAHHQNWSEAIKLSEEHKGKFDEGVFLPYALWLRDKGRFDEALEAFRKAGRRDLSSAMTERLMSVTTSLFIFILWVQPSPCGAMPCMNVKRTTYRKSDALWSVVLSAYKAYGVGRRVPHTRSPSSTLNVSQ